MHHQAERLLYGEYSANSPPTTVEIPEAEVGQWSFEITAMDVPHDDYPFAFVVGAEVRPRINAGGVVDAAGFRGVLAPGGIASLFGAELADEVLEAATVPLPHNWEAPGSW